MVKRGNGNAYIESVITNDMLKCKCTDTDQCTDKYRPSITSLDHSVCKQRFRNLIENDTSAGEKQQQTSMDQLTLLLVSSFRFRSNQSNVSVKGSGTDNSSVTLPDIDILDEYFRVTWGYPDTCSG